VSIVVTGAGGYVGGRLVQHLGGLALPTLRTPVPWLPDAVVADLLVDDLVPLFAGHQAVVHLAGLNETHFRGDADRAYDHTVAATERVASAARAAGVPRLVYLSTFHVYGSAAKGLVQEDVPATPVDGYGASRLEGERLAAEHGPHHTVSLRLTNGVGPLSHPDVERKTLGAYVFCRMAATGGDIEMRDSGHGLRDFVDLAEACRVIGAAAAGALPRDTYNLGSGVTTSIRRLADEVADAAEEVLGRRPAVVPGPPDGDAPDDFRVSVEKLAEHVDRPNPDLRPALVETIRLLA